MPIGPNDTVGRYRIESLLGEGGMGRVFRAFDGVLKRYVALKVLRTESDGSGSSAATRRQLLHEAQAAAALDHPNVVAVFDVGEAEGEPWIAMELVAGKSLRSFIGDASIPMALRLGWLRDIASALQRAHERGLVHRDVKPANVLVREDGLVKVLDFGIARMTKRVAPAGEGEGTMPTLTDEGAFLGTPKYMAPEQLRGESVDGRADQFAWAVLAYQLVTGALPWRRTDREVDVVAAILMEKPEPVAEGAPDLPASVAEAIDRALAKDPWERFSSMEPIVAALDPHVAPSSARRLADASGGPPTERDDSNGAAPFSVKPDLGKRPARRATLAAAASAIVLAAVATAAVVTTHPASPKSADVAPLDAGHVAITDLPKPTTSVPAALVAYTDALQALRDGGHRAAVRELQRAVDLDPSLAAAHLRLAIYSFYAAPVAARDHMRLAVQRRATLSDHDQALLDAMIPYIQRQPADLAEWDRRLAAAAARFPNDAELLLLVARGREGFGSDEVALYDRAIAADDKFGAAYAYKAQSQLYSGDLEGAAATLATCLRVVPSATLCVHQRDNVDAFAGDCTRLEESARQIIALEPQTDLGYRALADATYARGKPFEAVRAALEQAWPRTVEGDRAWRQVEDVFAMHVLAGEFADAEHDAHELESLVASDASLAAHARPARMLVDLYVETGRTADAAKVAEAWLRRREAWVPDPRAEDFALARDPAPLMMATMLHAGRLSADAFALQREGWIQTWKKSLIPKYTPFLWVHGWAVPTSTSADAEGALAALPAYRPIPRYAPRTLADADIGRTFLLAGKTDDAMPYLRAAASSCLALQRPFEHTHANLDLGLAREKSGDTDGACASYRVVVRRWGEAKTSTSGARAKERMRALACARQNE
ncbi:MAG TPA: protein kinase [Labilithrix sp.]